MFGQREKVMFYVWTQGKGYVRTNGIKGKGHNIDEQRIKSFLSTLELGDFPKLFARNVSRKYFVETLGTK